MKQEFGITIPVEIKLFISYVAGFDKGMIGDFLNNVFLSWKYTIQSLFTVNVREITSAL